MTSDHRLSLFEFLHAADRLLWSYRSAIDRNARARLTSDDLLLNDFCARAASRARCLLDDDLARRSHGGGSDPHPGSAPDGVGANPSASDGEGGETADSAGGRGRAHARRSHGAGMNKLHAAIQARRAAEAQRAAAAASARKPASNGATDQPHPEDSEWNEPTSSTDSSETIPGDDWELGPDPFESNRGATSSRRGTHSELPTSSASSASASPPGPAGGTSGWSSTLSRRRSPR